MNDKVYVSSIPTKVPEAFDIASAKWAAADVAVSCAICEESIPIDSNYCRPSGVFICDKCKAAIKHMRNILENGESVY